MRKPLVYRWTSHRVTKALEDIQGLPRTAFDRYENPFERKWTLREKFHLPSYVQKAVEMLEDERTRLMGLFEMPLIMDADRHYTGVFIYEKGDKLDVHVDAGVHPKNGLKKAVTAILYLGETTAGPLEFWNGDSCLDRNPKLHQPRRRIPPGHGRVVFFENSDDAWHGMEEYQGEVPRYVITVSYLTRPTFEGNMQNRRQRAFFVPRPDEQWDQEKYRLRDLRADSERYAEVYRV